MYFELILHASFDSKKSIKTDYVLKVNPWSHGGQEVLDITNVGVNLLRIFCLFRKLYSILKILSFCQTLESCSSYFISAYRVLLGTELGSGCSSRSSFLKLDVRDLPGMNKQRDKWLEHYQDRISEGFIEYFFIP